MRLMIEITPKWNKILLDFAKIWPHNKILVIGKKTWSLKFCWSLKFNEEKAPPQPKATYSQRYPGLQKLPDNFRSTSNDRFNAQRGRSDSPYVANRTGSRSKLLWNCSL